MARGAFSPLRFFRQSPADLLHQYFESRGLIGQLDVDWPAGLWPQPETLAKAIADAPDKARGVIERDLRRIHAMANREGVAALLEQAVSHDEHWSARFGEMPSHQARALWAFVEAR